MAIDFVRLDGKSNAIYKKKCDVDGCTSSFKYTMNDDIHKGWKKLEYYGNGKHITTKHICPEHQLL